MCGEMDSDVSKLQPIAQSTGDFPKLRTEGCVYVDKTAYFHRMITTKGCESVFLARPRRFGKSLMITTLKADKPAVLAMSQIERRDYAAPYRAAQKPVYCIGLAFDSQTRHLTDHVVEVVE